MKYKKLISLVISFTLLWITSVAGFAAKSPTVFVSNVNANVGEAIFIPVQIKDNPGIMGFRITVSYDSKILTPRAVTRGTVTQKGMFEDSVGSNESTSIDIVWNNTKEIKEDGTLAVVGFSCSAKAKEQTEIQIAFSREDTFNEKYEDVLFECKNGVIDFTGGAETSERTDKRDVTPEDIVLAVETVQGDPQITPTNAVMESVNSLLSQITGNSEPYFSTPDEITDSYTEAVKETFVKDVLETVDESKVVEVIQNALDLSGSGSIEDIPEDMRIDFINNVEYALKEELPDVKELSAYVSQENEFDVVSSLYDEANKELKKKNSPAERITAAVSDKSIILTTCVIFGAILLILIVLFTIKKKQSDKKSKN